MKPLARKFARGMLISALILQFSGVSALAADLGAGLTLSEGLSQVQPGNEFVSGNYPGAVLMPVNLWGAVQKTGIHHIPVKTDLVTFLSLAGGPTADAQINGIIIRRRTGGEEKIIKVNGEDLLTRPEIRSPQLEANDIIVVPRDKPFVSNNVVNTVGVIGGILGIILAGIVLNNELKK